MPRSRQSEPDTISLFFFRCDVAKLDHEPALPQDLEPLQSAPSYFVEWGDVAPAVLVAEALPHGGFVERAGPEVHPLLREVANRSTDLRLAGDLDDLSKIALDRAKLLWRRFHGREEI